MNMYWVSQTMVLILDGKSEYGVHVQSNDFNNQFDVDENKCLKQIISSISFVFPYFI